MNFSGNIENLFSLWKPKVQDFLLKNLESHFEILNQYQPQNQTSFSQFHKQILYALGLDAKKTATGKMLRSSLVLLSHFLENENIEKAIPMAVAIEIIHAFTLVHDDIQDNSLFRRGRPSVWKQYQVNHAINVGDYLFSHAFSLLNDPSFQQINDYQKSTLTFWLSNTISTICAGQYLDMEFEKSESITEPEYMTMIGKKTAALIQLSMQSGAFLASASPERLQLYSQLGFDIGLCFQIQDDWLDTWGDEKKTGKRIHSDILSKKKNYPFVLLWNFAVEHKREMIKDLYNKDQLTENDIAMILSFMNDYSIENKVHKKIEEFSQKIQQTVKNLSLDKKETLLQEFLDSIQKREK